MNNILIAFVIFLILMFISRDIIDKANKKLEQDKKADLVKLFSNIKAFTFGILIAIIILFYFSNQFDYISLVINFIIYFVLVIGVISTSSYFSYKKLKENNYPEIYIKSFILSTAIKFLALVLLFAFLKL